MALEPSTVLFIEDHPGEVRLIRELLAETTGGLFHLEAVGRLSEAVTMLTAHPADVVLLDLVLPDSYGLETLQRVRAQAPQVPIVVLTGSDDEVVARQALHAGAQDYLIKGELTGHWLVRALTYAVERQQAEREREHLLTSLRTALHEKEVLLREVHHRVKNNLQVIASLLDLQAETAEDPRVRAAFEESQARLQAIALIHEQLYQGASLARLDATNYLRRLSTCLFETYGPSDGRITLELEVEKIALELNVAIPCGLMLNELLSNALKHAFPGGRPGTVTITLRQEPPGTCILTVRDTGVGLPASLDIRQTDSLGLQLVSLLIEQLGGTLTLARGSGTTVILTFPLPPS